ncbi:glycosyltransferase family 2 protein [Devosia sp. LjRoot16]|uniref:glycosyltransferase family 2 protein n=1 Tax=Devosia sp. LjRoot16 TaxID=3342271 RepID=UPI003ED0537A
MTGAAINISMITATFNSGATLPATLQSLAAQTYGNVEHLVIDGGSSDNTMTIVQSDRFANRVALSEPDDGLFDALNKGVAKATGDVIGILHSDDVLASSDVLESVAREFRDPAVMAVYGNLTYETREAPHKIIRYWHSGEFTLLKLRRGWMPPHPTLYLRRPVYERFGVFDCSYRIAADYDFVLRVLPNIAGGVRYLDKLLVRMKVGGTSNRSLKNIIAKSAEDLRALRSNEIGGWGSLLLKNTAKIGQFWHRPASIS